MFTDIVGFTSRSQADEAGTLRELEEHRVILRSIFPKHNGTEVKTIGDAFLVEFPSALEAVRCSADIQQAMRNRNESLPQDRRIQIRVGVHLGDVIHQQGDILGDAVNVSSRIEPLALPGGVCISEQVYDHVRNKVDFPLEKLEGKTLKNVSVPVDVYRIVMPWEIGTKKEEEDAKLDTRRVAVMPLTNMSPDPTDEYFADGMTEELISEVSKIKELSVISRTSVMEYKGKGKKIAEVGEELNVGTVLEGSVRRAGNRVRVTVQLIDVADDRHLWSEKYDRELDDIFKIQDDIAGKIAEALRITLGTAPEPAHERTGSMVAYTLYLKGRALWNRRSKEGVLEALKLFQEAIKVDPGYAKAYSGLADAYVIAASQHIIDRAEGNTKGREAVTRALELDDQLPEAHASLGLILLNDLRFQEAQREFRRAIELNPSYASAHHWYYLCLANQGSLSDASDEIRKASELDPLSSVIMLNLAAASLSHGRLDEAIATFDRLIEKDPTYAPAYQYRALCFALKGMKERAFAEWEVHHALDQDEDLHTVGLALFHALFGDEEEALRLLQDALDKTRGKSKFPMDVADCYALLGKGDEFFAWVDRAIDEKSFMTSGLRTYPFYDKVKNDPRFPEIFRKLGLLY